MNFKQLKVGVILLKYCILSLLLIFITICIFKCAKANDNKKKLEGVRLGMTKDEVIKLLGEPYTKYKDQYKYRINSNPLYPIRTVIGINNGVVDTIYTLED